MFKLCFISLLLLSVFVTTWVTSSHATNLPEITGNHSQEKIARTFLQENGIGTEEGLLDAISHVDRKELHKFFAIASAYRHMEKKSWAVAKKIYQFIYHESKIATDSDKSTATIGLSKISARETDNNGAMEWAKAAINADRFNPYAYLRHADMCFLFFLKVKCVDSLQAALELTNEPKIRADVFLGLGNASVEDKLAQIRHYQEAFEIGEQLNDLKIQAGAYLGLGNASVGDKSVQIAHYEAAGNVRKLLIS